MPEERLASIVIPVWRDEEALTRSLHALRDPPEVDIIVACALGEEPRYERLRQAYPAVRWVAAPRGRASQMNAGAAMAAGRWILFLHADSKLPSGWLEVIAQAEQSPRTVAGAFRLALDSPDPRARIVEAGVRLRVALLALPYGDQALFVRRRAFHAMGGYRDLPLMEDVDFVQRVKRVGRLMTSPAAVRTSARRWERDGWARRSAQNASLATRFLLGASPARLAQRYFGRKGAAVVMMARAPWTGGKSRIGMAADPSAHADLRHALFRDTLDVATSVPGVDHIIACEPAAECERMREAVGSAVDVIPQRGDDLGERMAHAFEDVFRLGIESVVLVGSDLPDLPSQHIREALAVLRGHPNRIVIGPATDGGYYLIGMNGPHAAIFRGIEWGTERALEGTLRAAKALNLQVVSVREWADVDEPADLARLMDAPADLRATRTRAWIREHPAADAAERV